MKISVVTPVYKSYDSIEEFVSLVLAELNKLTEDYEIILVNDGSPDNSLHIIEKICKENHKVKCISLSKNFGQHNAIHCGLSFSKGDVVIVMDCDLQENPSYIPLLVKKYQEGYDIVYTIRNKRNYSFFKNFLARVFTIFYNYLIDDKLLANNENVGSFSLISRKVVQNFLLFKDCQFHYLIILRWLGFNSTYVYIQHAQRKKGKSSYNFKRLFEHALVAIIFQSDKLLRANIYIGFLISFIAVITGIFIVINYFLHGFAQGWTSIFVLILFTFGAVLSSIGIVGLYIGKMFDQTKQRPLYIIDKKINI